MVDYCKKCEAEVSPGNEFCGKCGERVILKPFFNKKRMVIQSFYLTLGGIAAYLSLIFMSIVVESSLAEYTYDYFNYSILLFLTAMSLIISYQGFIYSKRYTRFTGLLGCILLMIVSIYWLSPDYVFGIIAILRPIILLISSIVLLIITLIFWKDV